MDNPEKLMGALRQGLSQYVGAMLTHTAYEGEDARQIVAASLIEEALTLILKPESSLFVSKPLLRATVFVLRDLRDKYEETEPSPEVERLIKSIGATIQVLNTLVKVAPSGQKGTEDGSKQRG